MGWTGSNSETPQTNITIPTGSTGNKTYTANWKVKEYQITYNLNGGNIVGQTDKYTIETADFILPEPTRENYSFIGWTGSNGEIPQKNVTIKKGSIGIKEYVANWQAIKYSISYNLNGGSITGQPDDYTIETENFTLPTPTKTGYNFIGWTGSNGTTPQAKVTIAKGNTGNKNYIANWSATQYTITYNLNGGTLANEVTSYSIESPNIVLPVPNKTEYDFIGWTGSNGNTAQTSVTIPTGSTGNKAYTANWKGNTATFVSGSTFNTRIKSLTGDLSKIKNVKNTKTVPSGAKTVDLTNTNSPEKITAYFDEGTGIVYISTDAKKIYLNINSNDMFSNWSSIIQIDALSEWDTSKVKKMDSMFNQCRKLTTLNMNNFDTSNVVSMSLMFNGCSSLTPLNVSRFDTSNVTNMNAMFAGCSNLTTLNVSGFNTSNVTNMRNMFRGCSSLTKLDLSKFDTTKAEDMSYMFYYCNKLSSIVYGPQFKKNPNGVMTSEMYVGCYANKAPDFSNGSHSGGTN